MVLIFFLVPRALFLMFCYSVQCLGVVQGIVTGIRGLCNGLGPALYGLIFYIFHVNLTDNIGTATATPPAAPSMKPSNNSLLPGPNVKSVSVRLCFANIFMKIARRNLGEIHPSTLVSKDIRFTRVGRRNL